MTLIQVKNHSVLNIHELLRYVLRFVYEEEKMSPQDIDFMQRSIVYWKKAIDLENEKHAKTIEFNLNLPDGPVETHHKYSYHEECLQMMAKILVDNDEGLLDHRKKLFKEHGIDYRKFHRLPEAYTAEGLAAAAEMKRKYDLAHPEQEGLIKPGRMV